MFLVKDNLSVVDMVSVNTSIIIDIVINVKDTCIHFCDKSTVREFFFFKYITKCLLCSNSISILTQYLPNIASELIIRL